MGLETPVISTLNLDYLSLRKVIYLVSIVAKLKVNRIGGDRNERWNMWFNAIIHVESYQSQY